ncbi:hypothetical protein GCM10023199_43870 [Actinomycetospora chibensis]
MSAADDAAELTVTRGVLRRWAFALDRDAVTGGTVATEAVTQAIRAVLKESEQTVERQRRCHAHAGPPFAPELAEAARHPEEPS